MTVGGNELPDQIWELALLAEGVRTVTEITRNLKKALLSCGRRKGYQGGTPK